MVVGLRPPSVGSGGMLHLCSLPLPNFFQIEKTLKWNLRNAGA